MSTLLNLSGKIDPQTVAIFETVGRVIAELGVPYVVVGATARDLVLHLGHGAKLRSVTKDVDLAIEVPNWGAFNSVKDRLCEEGFSATKIQHRLLSPEKMEVDIVPFGQLEDGETSIAWPPKGDVVMNVLGFQETCNNAEWVRIQESPELGIPVATPAGMMLLKLVAWMDRAREERGKDAQDIAYLLVSYEEIPAVHDALYENKQIMEMYEWDQTLGASHLLGEHASSIVGEDTSALISQLAAGERNIERLIDEMCIRRVKSEYERNRQLLSAFLAGFGL